MKSHKQPPRFITRWVERLTDWREAEVILGDMQEDYQQQRRELGKWRADVAYIRAFLSLLFHRVLKRKTDRSPSTLRYMFGNYLKIAIRQIARQRLHNAINITGLALGLAVTIVITLFVVREMSVDRAYPNADRVYLAPMVWKFGSSEVPVAQSTTAVSYVWKETFSEVENFVRMQARPITFLHGDEVIEERSAQYVDSTFFDVFGLPLLLGNPKSALVAPRSIVLTETAAAKYFGEDWQKTDVMSTTLVAQNGKLYKITGVMKDLPKATHIDCTMMISMSTLPTVETEPNWNTSSMVTYLLLTPNADVPNMLRSVKERLQSKFGPRVNEFVDLDLVPLTDVYLRNPRYPGLNNTSDIKYVYIFGGIALLVLMIAIINYMNLSTARSMERAREVGVRKSVGALRRELFVQFLSESLLVTLMAIIGAVGMVYLMLPIFSNVSGKQLELGLGEPSRWLLIVGTWLLISFLGGIYPAFVLSSFKPALVLKGKLHNAGSGALLRKGLVVFQFVVSIFLIINTLTINDQLQYMTRADVGVDKEKLISIPMDSIARKNRDVIRESFATIAGVEEIALASGTPINIGSKAKVYGGDIGNKEVIIYNFGVDPAFVAATGIQLVAGSDFSPTLPRDSTWEFLINESALEFFGWSREDAIGKKLAMWGTQGVVRGIVKDFHLTSLQKPIEPLIIHAGIQNGSYTSRMLVRVQGDNFERITNAMFERWSTIVPASLFRFNFVQAQYDDQYQSESRLGQVMSIFSILAILIAALGLFGLASYTIAQRTKELGIRKVLGASLGSLLMIVSNRFLVLVTIAFVISAPLSWYAMRQWLATFAYSVPFNWVLALVSGLAAMMLALLTVSYHAAVAARTNPAQTLRTE